MLETLTNLLYGVGFRVRRFEAKHPDETVLAATATKAVRTREPMALQRGFHWVTSRRAALLITDRRVICGNWEVSVDDIDGAQLVALPGGLSRTAVLKLSAGEEHYQFGLLASAIEDARLPFAVERAEASLGMSRFSIAIRVAVLVFVILWAFGSVVGWPLTG